MKTPVGVSERKKISNIILQGESVSSISCTNTLDIVSKECKKEPYVYRNEVQIPKLSFVDDMCDVQVCDKRTREMNEYTMEEMNKRKLQMAADKCHRIHIGKKKVS